MIFDPKKQTKESINSVLPFVLSNSESTGKQQKAGFIIGYESGHIRVYMKSDSAAFPYKRAEQDRDDLYMSNEYE